MASSPSQVFFKKNTQRKKTIEKKKMQRNEGAYLSSLIFVFGMKHSSYFLLSTFLQRWALHLPQALCLTSLQISMLFKLKNSPEL
jgi:hypothetical protein